MVGSGRREADLERGRPALLGASFLARRRHIDPSLIDADEADLIVAVWRTSPN